jgi:hypothetical protein
MRIENLEMERQGIKDWIDVHIKLAPDGKLEGCDRVMLKDAARNMFSRQLRDADITTPAITANGEQPEAAATSAAHASHWLTISNIAQRMKLHPTTEQLKRAGVLMSGYYFKRHGKRPEKHEVVFAGGATRDVNSYTIDDLDLMENALREACA